MLDWSRVNHGLTGLGLTMPDWSHWSSLPDWSHWSSLPDWSGMSLYLSGPVCLCTCLALFDTCLIDTGLIDTG